MHIKNIFRVLTTSAVTVVLAVAFVPTPSAYCAEEKEKTAATTGERNFYEVLEDLMGDFEFDLKNGQVNGLKDVAIRNIAVSESVPPSFRGHLELLVTERILKTTKTRVIQCLPCKSKRTTVNGDQVVITSADTNPAELSRIAKMSNILHFMDVAFAYQSNGMVMSMYISEPESGSIVWSRSYNSETSRASAFRRGADYSQLDDARRMTEYAPQLQYRVGIVYMFEPNISGLTGCLGVSFRMMERYDNRRKEVGFEANYLKDASTIIGTAASAAQTNNLWGGLNLTVLFTHGWTFIGDEENYNKLRASFTAGIGGTYAGGYLGALVRTSYEWRLGKHYSVAATLGYRPQAVAILSNRDEQKISGLEFGLGINMLF